MLNALPCTTCMRGHAFACPACPCNASTTCMTVFWADAGCRRAPPSRMLSRPRSFRHTQASQRTHGTFPARAATKATTWMSESHRVDTWQKGGRGRELCSNRGERGGSWRVEGGGKNVAQQPGGVSERLAGALGVRIIRAKNAASERWQWCSTYMRSALQA